VNLAAVGEFKSGAGEVRDTHIHDQRLIGDVKSSLERDINLQLGRGALESSEQKPSNEC
jgi:hypothetical protein